MSPTAFSGSCAIQLLGDRPQDLAMIAYGCQTHKVPQLYRCVDKDPFPKILHRYLHRLSIVDDDLQLLCSGNTDRLDIRHTKNTACRAVDMDELLLDPYQTVRQTLIATVRADGVDIGHIFLSHDPTEAVDHKLTLCGKSHCQQLRQLRHCSDPYSITSLGKRSILPRPLLCILYQRRHFRGCHILQFTAINAVMFGIIAVIEQDDVL